MSLHSPPLAAAAHRAPLCRPSLAAARRLTFFDSWNECPFANAFLVDEEKWPAFKGLPSYLGKSSLRCRR